MAEIRTQARPLRIKRLFFFLPFALSLPFFNRSPIKRFASELLIF